MQDEISEIRARINIVDLVSQRVSLKKRGKNYTGLCPFHEDRNPSFNVNSEMGRYTCWSCGEKGDIFNWVMKTQNIEFADALKVLAQMAGVTLKAKGPTVSKSQSEMWKGAMEEALKFFCDQLKKSAPALAYCEKRDILPQTIDDWELGYAPDADGGAVLANHLKSKGYSLSECKSLFLVDQDSSGSYFDRFRARLIFPIRDEKGDIVAFGGRIMGDAQPKYINSGDTPLYRKSRVLYGFHRAKQSLTKGAKAILCEGYLDVIACHRAGAATAVASLGTSLTSDHAKLLKRWCDEVVILYDNDPAGQKAAERAIDIFEEAGLRPLIALMPKGDDPDSLLRREGPGSVVRAISAGVSPLEFRIQRLEEILAPHEPEFWSSLVEILAKTNNEMELDRFVVKFAHQYPGMPNSLSAQRALRRQVSQQRRNLTTWKAKGAEGESPRYSAKIPTSSLLPRERILFKAFLTPGLRPRAWEMLKDPQKLVTPLARDLAKDISTQFSLNPPTGEIVSWIGHLGESSAEALTEISMWDTEAPLTLEVLDDAFLRLKGQMERRTLTESRTIADDDDAKQEILSKLRKLKGVNKQS